MLEVRSNSSSGPVSSSANNTKIHLIFTFVPGCIVIICLICRNTGAIAGHRTRRSDITYKARFILLTPTNRRQSAAQMLTHTNIGPVHTPAFAADDLSLRGIRLVGVSIRRVQFSLTQATSLRQSLAILQSQASIHGLISALSLPR